MGAFLLVLIVAALAYIGYQLRRLIGFIEARQPAPPPAPPSRRAYVPLTEVSIPGSVAKLYWALSVLFLVVWVLSALSNAH